MNTFVKVVVIIAIFSLLVGIFAPLIYTAVSDTQVTSSIDMNNITTNIVE